MRQDIVPIRPIAIRYRYGTAHLRYFVAVGEEEHFGRAAQRLRVAQPALSRQIQDLEREIGFTLFDRLSRGVKISSAGKLFLEEARGILQQLNEATERAQRVARGQSGTLRVGFTENASWREAWYRLAPPLPGTLPPTQNWLNPAPSLQQLEPFDLADWMPRSCSTRRSQIGSWINCRSP